MKYLKTFENNNLVYISNKYWLIPTDEKFSFALEQIKCPEYFINSFLKNTNIPRDEYVFICNYIWCDRNQWSWNIFKGEEYDTYFEEKGNKYAGKILISDYELNAKKYNL